MDMDDIRDRLREHHAGVPQRSMLAQLALDRIESGMKDLEALGHRFIFGDEGPAPTVLIFPKMLYRDGEPEVQVHSTDELHDRLADGWREHPSEDIELGPRPNGHAEAVAKPPAVDATTSHPLAQSLAAPVTAQPAPSGHGFGYINKDPEEQQEFESNEDFAARQLSKDENESKDD